MFVFRALDVTAWHGKIKKTALLMLAFLVLQSPGAIANDKATRAMLADMKAQKWTAARLKAENSSDPFLKKLHQWLVFQNKNALKNKGMDDFFDLKNFIENHPHWPGRITLRLGAEENLPRDYSPARSVQWFDEYPPLSSAGIDRYVSALIKVGNEDKAREILREWWASALIPRQEQRNLYKKYKEYLGQEANIARLDVLLFEKHYSNARAIADVLGRDYRRLAEARIALANNKGNVSSLIANVSARLKNDAGLKYERLRWRRKRDLNDGMMQIFDAMPPTNEIRNPKDWWLERHILIRRLLEQKQYRAAFKLAKEHIQTEGFAYAQAEWMTGWLALNFMGLSNIALDRFQKFEEFVKTPISKARAAYWLGQTYKRLNEPVLSLSWLEKAAAYQTVFYGQIAGLELGHNKVLSVAPPPVLSEVERDQLAEHDLMRAALLLHKAGFETEAGQFLSAFLKEQNTAKAFICAAEWASGIGEYDRAVKIAKEASKQGLFLTAQAYPVIQELLQTATQGVNVEWALIHALIRQESLFDQNAKSSAGALGLMQLMPSTAKLVAKKEGITYRRSHLTSKPEYNITLGARYMEDLLDQYDRSYPLAIAAYNAGPGRVNRWLKEFGDPRKKEVSFIDWIELIPIYETRNYVHRVTEGLYVYRLRLRDVFKR